MTPHQDDRDSSIRRRSSKRTKKGHHHRRRRSKRVSGEPWMMTAVSSLPSSSSSPNSIIKTNHNNDEGGKKKRQRRRRTISTTRQEGSRVREMGVEHEGRLPRMGSVNREKDGSAVFAPPPHFTHHTLSSRNRRRKGQGRPSAQRREATIDVVAESSSPDADSALNRPPAQGQQHKSHRRRRRTSARRPLCDDADDEINPSSSLAQKRNVDHAITVGAVAAVRSSPSSYKHKRRKGSKLPPQDGGVRRSRHDRSLRRIVTTAKTRSPPPEDGRSSVIRNAEIEATALVADRPPSEGLSILPLVDMELAEADAAAMKTKTDELAVAPSVRTAKATKKRRRKAKKAGISDSKVADASAEEVDALVDAGYAVGGGPLEDSTSMLTVNVAADRPDPTESTKGRMTLVESDSAVFGGGESISVGERDIDVDMAPQARQEKKMFQDSPEDTPRTVTGSSVIDSASVSAYGGARNSSLEVKSAGLEDSYLEDDKAAPSMQVEEEAGTANHDSQELEKSPNLHRPVLVDMIVSDVACIDHVSERRVVTQPTQDGEMEVHHAEPPSRVDEEMRQIGILEIVMKESLAEDVETQVEGDVTHLPNASTTSFSGLATASSTISAPSHNWSTSVSKDGDQRAEALAETGTMHSADDEKELGAFANHGSAKTESSSVAESGIDAKEAETRDERQVDDIIDAVACPSHLDGGHPDLNDSGGDANDVDTSKPPERIENELSEVTEQTKGDDAVPLEESHGDLWGASTELQDLFNNVDDDASLFSRLDKALLHEVDTEGSVGPESVAESVIEEPDITSEIRTENSLEKEVGRLPTDAMFDQATDSVSHEAEETVMEPKLPFVPQDKMSQSYDPPNMSPSSETVAAPPNETHASDNDDDESSDEEGSSMKSSFTRVESQRRHTGGEKDAMEETPAENAVSDSVVEDLQVDPENEVLEGPEERKVELSLNDLAYEADCDTDLFVSVVTWNLAEQSPSEEDAAFIRKFRRSNSKSLPSSDFVMISGQECENIKPRRSEGHRSREFRRLMIKMLGKQFVPIAMHQLGGIQLGLFCKQELLSDLEHVSVADVTCGIGNVFHNKGAIGAFVQLRAQNPSSLDGGTPRRRKSLRMLFVTAHMAAHVKNVEARDSDFWRIAAELEAQAPPEFLSHVRSAELSSSRQASSTSADGGGGGNKLLSGVDRLFFCGDLNYRIDVPREMAENDLARIDKLLAEGATQEADAARLGLLRHDQLLRSMAEHRAFTGLAEGPIRFSPTFKFDKNSEEYDTSHKQRIPAWTDRVLFKPNGVRVLEYSSVPEATHSDHRPVLATFRVSRSGSEIGGPISRVSQSKKKPRRRD
jgi:phosphatidylinositol-bisphosphatase